jgi:hypothetical protein
MAEKPDVRVGQVWTDNDPRAEGRTLKVLEIKRRQYMATASWRYQQFEGDFALCQVLTERMGTRKSQLGRKVWIRVDRMRPTATGYRLVADVSNGAAEG